MRRPYKNIPNTNNCRGTGRRRNSTARDSMTTLVDSTSHVLRRKLHEDSLLAEVER